MMKKAQQMRTMLPMGLRDVMRVSTTSLSPGALLITLQARGVIQRDRERIKDKEKGNEKDYMVVMSNSKAKKLKFKRLDLLLYV